MRTLVVTHHLDMPDRSRLLRARQPSLPYALVRVETPCPALNRSLYADVGRDWYWLKREGWSDEEWRRYVERDEIETWAAYVAGAPAGYFELETQAAGDVEIAHVGLLSPFIGRGLGGAVLTAAVERAWAVGAARVWLHTCSLDHPHALSGYQARGFRVFKIVHEEQDLPDRSPTPWPGVPAPLTASGDGDGGGLREGDGSPRCTRV